MSSSLGQRNGEISNVFKLRLFLIAFLLKAIFLLTRRHSLLIDDNESSEIQFKKTHERAPESFHTFQSNETNRLESILFLLFYTFFGHIVNVHVTSFCFNSGTTIRKHDYDENDIV